jgi:hypothetical protein
MNPGDQRAVESLVRDPARRIALGHAAKTRARAKFAADIIVPRYEALYRQVCHSTAANRVGLSETEGS